MEISRFVLLAAMGQCAAASCWGGETQLNAKEAANLAKGVAQIREISFQQGVQDYSGTVDTEIWALARKTILDRNPNASSDANNDGGESQVVMRFDNIFGSGQRQIPPGSTIVSAKLIVAAFDQGSTVNLHRMLVPFGRQATWDSLISGVSADGFEASRHKDGFTFGKIAASTSGAVFDVTDTLQIWSQGQPNHGWVFLNTGGNGWDFYTAEFDKIEQRPKLVIKYLPPSELKTSEVAVEQSAIIKEVGGQ